MPALELRSLASLLSRLNSMSKQTSVEFQPQAASSLLIKIQQDPVLQGNCYLPLSIAIITHTFICMGHSLPATFCRIIEELALSCIYLTSRSIHHMATYIGPSIHLMTCKMICKFNSMYCVRKLQMSVSFTVFFQ